MTSLIQSTSLRSMRFAARVSKPTFSGTSVLARIFGDTFKGFGVWEQELKSLAGETNPDVFYHGLLNLGIRFEHAVRLEAAAAIYQALVSEAVVSLPSEIQARARTHWEAISGIGASGARLEFLFGRLAREALEPTTLLGLSAASAAFQATRLAVLTRLAASPAAKLWTRGAGSGAIASLAGFGVEGAVFPLATRLGGVALHRELDWSAGRLGTELAGSYVLLGALKLSGWGASLVYDRVQGLARNVGARHAVPLRHVSIQAGGFTGIYLGHQAESALGLRPRLDNATAAIDSLALWLQFNAAGHLARRPRGYPFNDVGAVREPPPRRDFGLIPIPENSRTPLPGPVREPPPTPNVLMMEKKDGPGDTPHIRVYGTPNPRRTHGIVEAAPDYRQAFLRFLETPKSREYPEFGGVLAEYVRHDGALRTEISNRLAADQDPVLVEILGSKGYVSKVFFFKGRGQNLTPERVIFAHKIIRYNESLDLMLYEIDWRNGDPVGKLFYPRESGPPVPETYNSGKIAVPEILGPNQVRWVLFPKTSYEIHLVREGASHPQWRIYYPFGGPLFEIPRNFP